MSNKLYTKTHEFDCDYCSEFKPMKQLFVRLENTTIAEIASVFSNISEISEMKYCGRDITWVSKLNTIRNEGTSIFVILE